MMDAKHHIEHGTVVLKGREWHEIESALAYFGGDAVDYREVT